VKKGTNVWSNQTALREFAGIQEKFKELRSTHFCFEAKYEKEKKQHLGSQVDKLCNSLKQLDNNRDKVAAAASAQKIYVQMARNQALAQTQARLRLKQCDVKKSELAALEKEEAEIRSRISVELKKIQEMDSKIYEEGNVCLQNAIEVSMKATIEAGEMREKARKAHEEEHENITKRQNEEYSEYVRQVNDLAWCRESETKKNIHAYVVYDTGMTGLFSSSWSTTALSVLQKLGEILQTSDVDLSVHHISQQVSSDDEVSQRFTEILKKYNKLKSKPNETL